MNIQLNKISYCEGDHINIIFDFQSSPSQLMDVTNININIIRVEVKRDILAFGFSYTPEIDGHQVIINRLIPENFEEGIYYIAPIKLIKGNHTNESVEVVYTDKGSTYFWYSKNNKDQITERSFNQKKEKIYFLRKQYVNTEIRSESAEKAKEAREFRVLVFGVGCLLHASQNSKGFIVHPLQQGYTYNHMREAVNSFLMKNFRGFTLQFEPVIEQSFSSSTPLFAIDFTNIKALSIDDAENHCRAIAENIYTILSYDRGQRPNTFAILVLDKLNGDHKQAFHFPGYRGNLVSDFSPTSTSFKIDKILPKIQSSNWLDLIMRIFSDAESELNPLYGCLKYWSVVEMIANKYVSDHTIELHYPNGKPICNPKINKPFTTQRARGKVYHYLINSGLQMMNYSTGDAGETLILETNSDARLSENYNASTKIVHLWDFVCAWYAVRNAIAHSGRFDQNEAKTGQWDEKIAAELFDYSYFFHSQTNTIVKHVVSLEIDRH